MTKKDYIKAAEIVREQREDGMHFLLTDAMEAAFVKLFKRDNSRFDEKRFRQACKVG